MKVIEDLCFEPRAARFLRILLVGACLALGTTGCDDSSPGTGGQDVEVEMEDRGAVVIVVDSGGGSEAGVMAPPDMGAADVTLVDMCPDPQDETCNGADDNCDGRIDEDFNVGDVCSAGRGRGASSRVHHPDPVDMIGGASQNELREQIESLPTIRTLGTFDNNHST